MFIVYCAFFVDLTVAYFAFFQIKYAVVSCCFEFFH